MKPESYADYLVQLKNGKMSKHKHMMPPAANTPLAQNDSILYFKNKVGQYDKWLVAANARATKAGTIIRNDAIRQMETEHEILKDCNLA